ncbi:MAG: mta2 [Sporomusa sp.]|jgi:hypothetical protein|nr:mta2 [Sporomusa sp.]
MDTEDIPDPLARTTLGTQQEYYSREIQLNNTNPDENQEDTGGTSEHTEKDWLSIKARADKIHQKLVKIMDKGPAAPEVQEVIAELQQHITDDVCNCTPDILRWLGDMYAYDKRLTANVDKYRPGFAIYLREAMHIYCNNLEKQFRLSIKE